MGVYIRKSLRFGLVRVNFSKSSVGLSAGIPGFRIGKSPRGSYIQVGKGGVYYRDRIAAGGDGNNLPSNEDHAEKIGIPASLLTANDLSDAIGTDAIGKVHRSKDFQFVLSVALFVLITLLLCSRPLPLWHGASGGV